MIRNDMLSTISNWCFIIAVIVLCSLSVGCSGKFETFKHPADQSVLEVVRDSQREVRIGVQNIPQQLENRYQLLLNFRFISLGAGHTNLEHYITVDADDCVSREVGTLCAELEVTVQGNPDIDSDNISLVLFIFDPYPIMVTDITPQQFTIRIVDNTTSTPVLCPPAGVSPNTQNGIPRTAGNSVLGVLLGAAFIASFIGNFVFIVLWYRAQTSEQNGPEHGLPSEMHHLPVADPVLEENTN